jgi:translation elongation factor EF-Tu-like GTPase
VPVGFDGELRLLTTAEGGRETPLASGYRSIVAEDTAPAWGVEITFDASSAALAPRESAGVHLWSWAWDESDAALPVGTRFFLYEGARLVGTGNRSVAEEARLRPCSGVSSEPSEASTSRTS